MKILILTLSLLLSSQGLAQIIRCRGDIGFWIPSKDKKWKKIEMNGKSYFEDFASNVGALKIAKDQRFPAAEIYPFLGIEYKIINKDLKITSDGENWFTVKFEKKQLSCKIHSGSEE